jgi:glycosyltransferase involved in cell wall biosynthesis
MKLTVVIPCYNELKTIDRIVAAVRQAPYPDKEIIIVDDCSIDGSTEKLRARKEIIESGRVRWSSQFSGLRRIARAFDS